MKDYEGIGRNLAWGMAVKIGPFNLWARSTGPLCMTVASDSITTDDAMALSIVLAAYAALFLCAA